MFEHKQPAAPGQKQSQPAQQQHVQPQLTQQPATAALTPHQPVLSAQDAVSALNPHQPKMEAPATEVIALKEKGKQGAQAEHDGVQVHAVDPLMHGSDQSSSLHQPDLEAAVHTAPPLSGHAPDLTATAPPEGHGLGARMANALPSMSGLQQGFSERFLPTFKHAFLEIAAKALASGVHLGAVNSATASLVRGKGPAVDLANIAISAASTAAAHFVMEEVVRPLIVGFSGHKLEANKDASLLPSDQKRLKSAQVLGTVNSSPGSVAGMTSFGIGQGTRNKHGWNQHVGPVAAGFFASGMGGGLMQLAHTVTSLTASIDGLHTHTLKKLEESDPGPLKAAMKVFEPKEIPIDGGAKRLETSQEVALRIAHDVVVGRAIPLFQGILMRTIATRVLPQGFGSGFAGSYALHGAGLFTMSQILKGRVDLKDEAFAGTKKVWASLNEPDQPLASLVDEKSPNEAVQALRGVLVALDNLNNVARAVFTTPAHLALDTVNLAVHPLQNALTAGRGQATQRHLEAAQEHVNAHGDLEAPPFLDDLAKDVGNDFAHELAGAIGSVLQQGPNADFAPETLAAAGLPQQNRDTTIAALQQDHGMQLAHNTGDQANCLLISLVQHATGDYGDTNIHQQSAAGLRRALNQAHPNAAPPGAYLRFDDALPGNAGGTVGGWLVNHIAQNFPEHPRLNVTFVNGLVNGQLTGTVPADVPGARPVAIFDQGGHFDALTGGDIGALNEQIRGATGS